MSKEKSIITISIYNKLNKFTFLYAINKPEEINKAITFAVPPKILKFLGKNVKLEKLYNWNKRYY